MRSLNRTLGLFFAAVLVYLLSPGVTPGAQQTPPAAQNEETDYRVFYNESNPDNKIQLAKQFAQKYPNSRHLESVEGSLTFLYFDKQDWADFFAAADKTLTLDPANISVLELVGWVIPRRYKPSDSSSASELDEAETYEKRALDAIGVMKKPNEVTQQQFENAQAGLTWRAHSGLGMIYFRRNDFIASAKELQLAIQQEYPAPDEGDLYVIGLDLQRLNRNAEAADAFSKCIQIAGDMLNQCRQAYGTASHAPPPPESANPVADVTVKTPATAKQAAAQQSVPTIKAQTNLMPVLVVVRDAKGHAFANLKEGDFQLDQDGKPQQIVNFAAMYSGGDAPVALSNLPNNATFDILARQQERGVFTLRNFALFFDDTHLNVSDLADVKTAAEKYVSALSPGDRVAIVTASEKGELDFTNDQSKLRTAIEDLTRNGCPPMAYWEAKAYLAQPRQFENVKAQFFSDISACGDFEVAPSDSYFKDHPAGQVETVNGRVVGATDALNRAYAVAMLENADIQTTALFDRFDELVRRMSTLPGERIVTLMSAGFAYPGQELSFANLVGLATRSNIVVNTIQADQTMHRLAEGVARSGNTEPAAIFGNVAAPGELESEKVLGQLADSTGGIYFHNSDDYAGALRQMAIPPESYYLLAYSPQNLAPDGAYHTLSVSVAGQKYTVQARRGFYAPASEENLEDAAKAETDRSLLSLEMQNQLPVKFDGKVSQDASGEKTITVTADVDLAHLSLQPVGGENQENLSIAAALFDANGDYVTEKKQLDQTKYDDEALEAASEKGFFTKFDFDVKPGDYVVRLVARNLVDGKVSSENLRVEVPKGMIAPPTAKQVATAEEDSAYELFDREPNPARKIQLGETFEQKYPKSRHTPAVESELVPLYYDTDNLQKFYATAEGAIAKDPDNIPLLTLVGWAIPRRYDANNPLEAALLAESEKYDKRALALIASMKKPRTVPDADFDRAKASQSWQPHSGLGIAYFRQGNYADSATELQLATSQESPAVDPFDLYILGLDLEKLHRNAEAADAFSRCGRSPGELQAQCQRDAQSITPHER